MLKRGKGPKQTRLYVYLVQAESREVGINPTEAEFTCKKK